MNTSRLTIILALTAILCACDNKSKEEHSFPIPKERNMELIEKEMLKSITEDLARQPIQHDSPSTSKSSDQATRQFDEDDVDNMRGFDPASEDDMDDNGMSRYMENDDEEDWN